MKFRLLAPADDLSSEGSAGDSSESSSSSSSITSSGGDDNFFGDDTPIGQSFGDAFKEAGLDPNKYGLDESDMDSEAEESQGSEVEKEAGQATDENALLSQLNAMGAIHNDSPIKVESIEEAKNLIQMGKDYTVKTQALSEERKVWDAEVGATKAELNAAIDEFNVAQKAYGQQLQEYEQWNFALNQLQADAPDVFEEVQRAYQGTVKQFTNPVLDKQLASIRAELAETKKGLSERENKLIVDGFESEKGKMGATEQSLKELGITVDWAKVKEKWAATGLPLQDVMASMHFESVTKAQASKSKVAAVKAKVTAKPTGAAGQSRPGDKTSKIDPQLKGLDLAKALLQKYQNN